VSLAFRTLDNGSDDVRSSGQRCRCRVACLFSVSPDVLWRLRAVAWHHSEWACSTRAPSLTVRSAERRGGHCRVIILPVHFCQRLAPVRSASSRDVQVDRRGGRRDRQPSERSDWRCSFLGLASGGQRARASPSETRKTREDRSPVHVVPESPSWLT